MKVTTDACLFGAWTAETIEKEQRAKGKGKFLDVGTGTGLLALMVAQKQVGEMDAVEMDAAAAGQAAENVRSSPWPGAIQVLQKDVLQWQPDTPYDVIFSNPPFYEREIRSEKEEKNVAHHSDGLKLGELLGFIKLYLKEDGAFFLLLPAKRKAELESLLKKMDLFQEKTVLVKPTTQHQPFRLMLQGRARQVAKTDESILSIKDNRDSYTPEFVALLQPYYLYL